jgi:hypothetical protein
MNAIYKIEVLDSTYSSLVDSLYRNIKGSWYEVSYKVSWTKNGPWETPAFTPNKNNYDTYLENNTTTSYANGNVIYRGYYYIDDKGNYVQIDSSGGVNLMEIKKLNGTDLELLFLDKTFFVHAFYKRL